MISIDKKLINEKNIRMLIFLNSYNLNEASQKAGTTYSHAIRLAKEWAEIGIIIIYKPEGAMANKITFTDKGKDLLKLLEGIYFFSKEKKLI